MKHCHLLLLSLLLPLPLAAETVYVSQAAGPAADGSQSHPYGSIEQALSGRVGRISADTLFVNVAPGDYYLARTLLLDGRTTRPVVVRGTGAEKPRIIGGERVEGWQRVNDRLWRAYLPQSARYGFAPQQFFVNGRRAVLARTPNEEWYFVKAATQEDKVKVPGARFCNYATQRIDFHAKDWEPLKGKSNEQLAGIKFRFYHKWDNTRKTAAYTEADSARIYFDGEGMRSWNALNSRTRYYMYDYREALDTAGEWYLDRNEGYLYYMPREDEDMEKAECIVPVLRQWVSIKGKKGSPVKGVKFENLSFQYTAYNIPLHGEEPAQAAANTEAGIMASFVEDLRLSDCEMLHTGGYGLWIGEECHRDTVNHCLLADLGAGGIKVGIVRQDLNRPAASHNVIDNNIITSAGHEQPCGVGVALFHTSDNQVTHNDIFDLYYSGVSVGWVWGYTPSQAKRNTVMYNHIHHIGWGELSDMGAVYTLGLSEGTRVSNNHIHDVLSYDYGGWGLYTDEGSTGVEMMNNLVYRCKSGAFHQHYGRDNRIENNIFANGHYYQVQYTRVENHRSFSFKRNILLQSGGELLAGPWDKGNIDMDYNLYWRVDGKQPQPKGKSLAEWGKEIRKGQAFARGQSLFPRCGKR